MKTKTVSDKDFKFIESEEAGWYGVELLTGKWKGVSYIYGQVKINEEPELGTATLGFTYQVVDSKAFEEDDLINDITFKNYLGGVLQHVITDSLEQREKTNKPVIRIGNNESNTDTYSESSD